MVRVLAVNNYPSTLRFERLRTALEGHGVRVKVIDKQECSSDGFNDSDGVVLSGSPDMLSSKKIRSKYEREVNSIIETRSPLLGICFGHQLVATAFGSRVVKDSRPVLGFVRTEILKPDPLFDGLSRTPMLLESRHEVVEQLPDHFELIARSVTSRIAAMKHPRLPLYGVQFHPERFTGANPDGNHVLANFVRLLS